MPRFKATYLLVCACSGMTLLLISAIHNGAFTEDIPLNPVHRCEKDIKLLVYVHTAPWSFSRRQTLRETWAQDRIKQKLNMDVVFLLGHTNNVSVNHKLSQENRKYRDLLQVDYYDHFYNLTYKTMAGIKWTADHCQNVPFILKADDDIFINMFSLVKRLESMERGKDTSNVFACYTWPTSKPKRHGKYGVSMADFAGKRYPEFCSGSAYLMTSDVISALAGTIDTVKPFKLDDVHVTAFMRQQAKLNLRPWNEAYLLYEEQFNQFLGKDWQNYLFSHVHNLKRFKAVWHKLEKTASSVYKN